MSIYLTRETVKQNSPTTSQDVILALPGQTCYDVGSYAKEAMVAFLKRKRRNSKAGKGSSLFGQLDWSINPETARELLGILFTVLGVLFLISIFHLAGRFGDVVISASKALFGLLGYIAPLVLLAIGIKLLLPRAEGDGIKASVAIGVIIAFLAIPGLFVGYGGGVGRLSFHVASSMLGTVGGYVLLLGLSVAALLVATNISIAYLWEKIKIQRQSSGEGLPRANVFTLRGYEKEAAAATARPAAPAAPRVLTSKEGDWEYPPLDLLSLSNSRPDAGNIAKNREMIQKTLKDFSIDVTMNDVNVGPTVSQYTLKPADGVKLSNIMARSTDLALVLAAPAVRIEAPIPGKALVGVEIPNKAGATVTLREILEAEDPKKMIGALTLALGRDAAGVPFIVDLKKMPHLLIAGSTGSGKSVCINSIITNLLYQNSPSQLRLLLVDPKRVEFTEYNGIPHLLAPVITEVDKTVAALKWVVAEMERRFKLLAESSSRNIEVYNDNPTEGKLPYLVVVVDELADLMAQAANDVENSIVRIAQMARAVGIHLIVATQRPSVDVITGIIKANIPTRIAFAVAAQADSRTILDQGGAEKLLGRGDMLYMSTDVPQPKRVQGVFIADKEIGAVTGFLKREGDTMYDESITAFKSTSSRLGNHSDGDMDDDLFADAKEVVMQSGKASASLLQRRLRVGYARAARLLDILEQEGIIGPADGAKPRDILAGHDDYGGGSEL